MDIKAALGSIGVPHEATLLALAPTVQGRDDIGRKSDDSARNQFFPPTYKQTGPELA